MADNDELAQTLRDMAEQSRQQHQEAMKQLADLGTKVQTNEQKTQQLADATRATFQAVDQRMNILEQHVQGLSSGRSTVPQLPSSTDKGGGKGGETSFGQDFLTGFTGGLWQPKK